MFLKIFCFTDVIIILVYPFVFLIIHYLFVWTAESLAKKVTVSFKTMDQIGGANNLISDKFLAEFRHHKVLVCPQYQPGPGPTDCLPGPPGHGVLLQVPLPRLQGRHPGYDVIVARTHDL